jgi:hypothetical protein
MVALGYKIYYRKEGGPKANNGDEFVCKTVSPS